MSFASLNRPYERSPLRTEGNIPDALRGTLLRCGPALLDRFGVRSEHPFEADGGVMSVQFGAGGVHGQARVLETPAFREEEAAGRRLYGMDLPWPQRLRNAWTNRNKNTGNTALLQWDHRLFALMEAGRPIEFDASTLAVLGETNLDGAVDATFSAHPHRIAKTGDVFNFGFGWGANPHLRLIHLPPGGKPRTVTEVPVPANAMVHDFALTERHAIFIVPPLELVMWRAMLGWGDMAGLFDWRPQRGVIVKVVPLADPDAVRTYEIDPFFVFHIANAYEQGEQLVVDLCTYDDAEVFKQFSDEPDVKPRLERLRIGSNGVRRERLAEHTFEFPHVHPAYEARRHEVLFGVDNEGLSQVDLRTGKRKTFVGRASCSEPILVPRGPDPDDVWALTMEQHETNASVAIIDGKTLELAGRVHFDQPMFRTFHGTWLPEAPC